MCSSHGIFSSITAYRIFLYTTILLASFTSNSWYEFFSFHEKGRKDDGCFQICQFLLPSKIKKRSIAPFPFRASAENCASPASPQRKSNGQSKKERQLGACFLIPTNQVSYASSGQNRDLNGTHALVVPFLRPSREECPLGRWYMGVVSVVES